LIGEGPPRSGGGGGAAPTDRPLSGGSDGTVAPSWRGRWSDAIVSFPSSNES